MRSDQTARDQFHEHSRLHVVELVYDHLSVFLLFTKLFSAIYTLVSSYTTTTHTAWGAPECILSLFEVLYSIVNPHLILTLVCTSYLCPSFSTFNPVLKKTSSFLNFPLQGL